MADVVATAVGPASASAHKSLDVQMVRPKKSAIASRANGSRAKNKGKAKKTVPVLDRIEHARTGDYAVRFEWRAQLPKGYVAYESEIRTQERLVKLASPVADTPEPKDIGDHLRECAEREEQSIKLSVETKGWDMDRKVAKLKEITKGATTPFVFDEGAAEQPRRRAARGRRSR